MVRMLVFAAVQSYCILPPPKYPGSGFDALNLKFECFFSLHMLMLINDKFHMVDALL